MEDLISEAQKPKITCYTCRQPCAGEVLRVQDKHFHITCFVCRVCRRQLATDGFFLKDGMYYCTRDYQEMFGTKCHGCGDYVEGEVVTALGKTYHQKCFVCSRCRQPFPPGDRVTFNGRDCLCKFCITPNAGPNRGMPASTACAGCGDEIKSGQALLALDKQWHLWCFKCTQCGCMLAGEYMGKEGRPYCERDYQQLFGVKCAGCLTYITGKVLQLSVEAVLLDDGSFTEAGEKHYHPHCAKCAKCGLMFGEGEEMYLQDNQIWHPDCSKAAHANGIKDQYWRHQDYRVPKQNYYPIKQIAEKLGTSAPPYRAKYPKSTPRCPQYILQTPPKSPLKLRRQVPSAPMLKQKNSPTPKNRMYMGSYLNKPHGMQRASGDPKDPKQKHFHTPDESEDAKKKTAKLDDDIVQATRYPSGFRPQPDFPSRIERDDWPGPPSPAATGKSVERVDVIKMQRTPAARPKTPDDLLPMEKDDWPAPHADFYYGRLRRSTSPLEEMDRRREQEHMKVVEECQSGLGKMILKDMKPTDIGDIDPRSASRVPAADHEPPFKPRYDSPVDASPSRTYVSHMEENVDVSPRQPNYAPPGGYLEAQKKASTLPAASRPGMRGARDDSGPDLPDFEATYVSTTYISLQKKPHTTENGLTNGLSGPYWDNEAPGALHSKSSESSLDHSSAYSSSPVRSREVSGSDLGSLQRSKGQSLPDMGPPKIYPVVELLTTNYKLPPDVDRSKLEKHMSDADFEAVFHMTREEFSSLATWRRTELKKRAHLF
ncbi:PREDICTED: actin-binding LIM protein 1-like isoform X1 [Branchiostoma belcheri]|uniref:Actin-binding LIM protein 1-like isoform X1 n=1 Tax=Branchiostoma belcheri TaxID=7741 RepID=A0A6P4Z1Y3_BRABE|nr:PREDICTED: actin-binding LIM protein 1-like isoform X1 [Branchiostoma belcheri]